MAAISREIKQEEILTPTFELDDGALSDDDGNNVFPEDDVEADEFPIDEEGYRILLADNPDEYRFWQEYGVERWRIDEEDYNYYRSWRQHIEDNHR